MSSVRNTIDKVLYSDGNGQYGRVSPNLISSSKTRTSMGFHENAHEEVKRPVAMEERSTKQRFKMPVSTMSSACSICSKTSQSGVGGICKGCWSQFQAKGVRIGNMDEFVKFTESVKTNVSKISIDHSNSGSQISMIESLRSAIPKSFFKEKHRREPVNMDYTGASHSKTKHDTTTTPKLSGATKEKNDVPCERSLSNVSSVNSEHSEIIATRNEVSKKHDFIRSKTFAFVDSSKQNVDLENKTKYNDKTNIEIDPKNRTFIEKTKVTRQKTQFTMKSRNEISQKYGSPSVSHILDKPNDTEYKTKIADSDNSGNIKTDKVMKKFLAGKQKYEPITIKQSSKLSHANNKISNDSSSPRKSQPKNLSSYDNDLKLGTRSLKNNAFRQMDGKKKSSSDEDDDDDTKSSPKKNNTYKPLEEIKVQKQTIRQARSRITTSKQITKEAKPTKSRPSSALQSKYHTYSNPAVCIKTEDEKKNDNVKLKTDDSIYFNQGGLVATLSTFINKNECFKNPNDEAIQPNFQISNTDDDYFSNEIKDPFKKNEVLAIENQIIKKNPMGLYFDDQTTDSLADDYLKYKKQSSNLYHTSNDGRETGASNDYYTTNSSCKKYAADDYYTEMPTCPTNGATPNANVVPAQVDDTYFTGGFNGRNTSPVEYTGNMKAICASEVKRETKASSSYTGESYTGLRSNSSIYASNDNYTGTVYGMVPINQQINNAILHRPAPTATASLGKLTAPSFPNKPESERIVEQQRPTNSKRMLRKRNKIMDEMIERNIESAGEFISKAVVSFKNPFNNFNSNSNMWYGTERAVANSDQDDMMFEKPNYTDWDPEFPRPVFKKPLPKPKKEPLVLDFLKYENAEQERKDFQLMQPAKTEEWYAGTEEGFHGPLNTTWDGRNWKGKEEERPAADEEEDVENIYNEKDKCRSCKICPDTNSSCLEDLCKDNVNNNYPDYDKYDQPMVEQKKIVQPVSMGNDRDYAPMLYAVPDTFVTSRQTPSPVNYKHPTPPMERRYENSYFFMPQSNCDDEPEYAGYERKKPIEIMKEPSPPPIPKVYKVGSIMIRNNVENDFDYAENVNRDLNDESFGAMGFNQRAQEMNSMPFPHATASTLMEGNINQIIDVQQALRREWSASKAPIDNLPLRSAPVKMDMPHQMEQRTPNEETVKKMKHSKTRATSVTSDAVHRRNSHGHHKEHSAELEPIKKPTVPRKPSISNNTIKRDFTPRHIATPRSVNPNRIEKKQQTPRPHQNTKHQRKEKNNKDGQNKGFGLNPLKWFSKAN